MTPFDGKVAFITGAASGIGRACALGFAAEGARVVVLDRNGPGAEETVELVRQQGGDALLAVVDVVEQEAVAGAVETAVRTYGSLDFAVNCAGAGSGGQVFAEVTDEDWADQIAINLNGLRLSMKHELAQMRRQGSGSIVNISSGAGLRGVRRSGGYSPSKHAVVGATKTAALDHALEGIRVNAICPGFVVTPMTDEFVKRNTPEAVAALLPMGRPGQPHEIADAAVWLCSDRASFVTGVALPVDGGWAA